MKGIWQVAIAVCAVVLAASAGAASEDFGYDPPTVVESRFDENLTMLDRERGEYATNLATHAANLLNTEGTDKATLEEARRLLALAMHLSPRNRKVLVVNSQLRRGVMPEKTEGAYSAGVLARLLLTRAELLRREGGNAQNGLLSRCFVELAADLDPRNEDAVYAFELQRITTVISIGNSSPIHRQWFGSRRGTHGPGGRGGMSGPGQRVSRRPSPRRKAREGTVARSRGGDSELPGAFFSRSGEARRIGSGTAVTGAATGIRRVR